MILTRQQNFLLLSLAQITDEIAIDLMCEVSHCITEIHFTKQEVYIVATRRFESYESYWRSLKYSKIVQNLYVCPLLSS